MTVENETESELEEKLKEEGFELTGFSEGKVYRKMYKNGANVLYFVIPSLAKNIDPSTLTIEVSYVVNGLKVTPEKVEVYRLLKLPTEIPYNASEVERIINTFKKVF